MCIDLFDASACFELHEVWILKICSHKTVIFKLKSIFTFTNLVC